MAGEECPWTTSTCAENKERNTAQNGWGTTRRRSRRRRTLLRMKNPLEDLRFTRGAKPIYDEITKNELNCKNRILRQLSWLIIKFGTGWGWKSFRTTLWFVAKTHSFFSTCCSPWLTSFALLESMEHDSSAVVKVGKDEVLSIQGDCIHPQSNWNHSASYGSIPGGQEECHLRWFCWLGRVRLFLNFAKTSRHWQMRQFKIVHWRLRWSLFTEVRRRRRSGFYWWLIYWILLCFTTLITATNLCGRLCCADLHPPPVVDKCIC